MLQVSRRGLIGSLGALFVAPAIVRAESLMKVKPVRAGAVRYLYGVGRDIDGNEVRELWGEFLIDSEGREVFSQKWLELSHARILKSAWKVTQEMLDVRSAS